jgi:hypothetical protein
MFDLDFYLCFSKIKNTLKLPVTLFRILFFWLKLAGLEHKIRLQAAIFFFRQFVLCLVSKSIDNISKNLETFKNFDYLDCSILTEIAT